MPIPPDPILRAARRWCELLAESGVQRARSLLTTNSLYGDITPTQYATALSWLEASGLLEACRDAAAPVGLLIYEQAVTEASWFPDTDALVRSADELPIDALSAAEALDVRIDLAFDRLRTRWGKVDTESREAAGAAGEAGLLALLDSTLKPGATAEHVSEWSDGLGYDIAVRMVDVEAHLEVKSSTRAGRALFFLSRNEYETLLTDPAWILVFVHLSTDLRVSDIETIDTAWLRQAAPVDTTVAGRWESCRFEAPGSARAHGVPALAGFVEPDSPVLTGAVTSR